MPMNSNPGNNTALVPHKPHQPPDPGPVYDAPVHDPLADAYMSHFYWLPALAVWYGLVFYGLDYLDNVLGLRKGDMAYTYLWVLGISALTILVSLLIHLVAYCLADLRGERITVFTVQCVQIVVFLCIVVPWFIHIRGFFAFVVVIVGIVFIICG